MKLNTLQLRRAANALLLGLLMGVAMPKMNAQTAHVGDILCEGDLIVSPANYPSSGATAKAVVFYVDNTGQHGWAIALQDVGSYNWGPKSNDTPLANYGSAREAIYDLDGYENTQTLHNSTYPAFNAVDIENGWYLPAMGQLNYLYGNLAEVNTSLLVVGGIQFTGDWTYWSSTENSYLCAWYLTSSGNLSTAGVYSYYWYYKDYARRVRAAINF